MPGRRPRLRSPLGIGLLCLLGLLGVTAANAPARAVATKGVTDLKVGDRGYCLTVFRGLKPERFRIRVQGILFNYFPRQHLILITSDDPKVKRSGIVAGMSGSPCYVGGKLVGALAYGPNWTKRPVAMLTPIRVMLQELKRPRRGLRRSPVASHARPRPGPRPAAVAPPAPRPRPEAAAVAPPPARRLARDPRTGLPLATRRPGGRRPPRRAAVRRATRQLAWARAGNPLAPWYRALPAPLSARVRRAVAGMRRLSVPLSVSGLDAQSLKELKKELAPYGFQVVQGGASSQDALRYYQRPKGFVAGGSIGVQLMRGAVSMNGTGTVTHVAGDQVLAFGHPMANWGEHYIPVTGSWIHMFMPAYSSSYKISTSLNELGSLVLDRRPCILADTSQKAPMIPVKVRLSSPAGGEANFDFEVFSNRRATPYYINYALRSILRKEVSDVYDTTIGARFAFDTAGAGRFVLDDYFFTRKGAGYGFSISNTRGYKVLAILMSTPLGKVRLERVQVRVRVEHKVRIADIEDVKLSHAYVAPGDRITLRVVLKRRYGGGRYVKRVPVRIPRHVPPGSLLRIEVSDGTAADVDAAPPESLADLRRIVSRLHHARQLVVRVLQPGEGTSVGGRIVEDLPGSVVDSLRRGTSVKTQIKHRTSVRKVLLLDDVISGKKKFYVRLEEQARP